MIKPAYLNPKRLKATSIGFYTTIALRDDQL